MGGEGLGNPQGQGPGTAQKEKTFASAIAVNLKIAAAKTTYPYVHADLHSGSGYNYERGCDGSPTEFYRQALLQGVDFRAFFCDHDPAAAATLQQSALADDWRVHVKCCDNSVLLDDVACFLNSTQPRPCYAIGSLVIDPNGYFHEEAVPHERLMAFAREFPRIDLIFNLNLYMYHCSNGCKNKLPESKWESCFCPHPQDIPELFSRKHGLVQIRAPGRGHQFITLVLRNLKTGSHAKLDLHDIKSEKGAFMLQTLKHWRQMEFRLV